MIVFRVRVHLDLHRVIARSCSVVVSQKHRLESVVVIWKRCGAVACRKPSMKISVVAWLRRPKAKFRTSLVLRSMATKQ